MSVHLECECGYRKSLTEFYAGKQVACPQCGSITQLRSSNKIYDIDALPEFSGDLTPLPTDAVSIAFTPKANASDPSEDQLERPGEYLPKHSEDDPRVERYLQRNREREASAKLPLANQAQSANASSANQWRGIALYGAALASMIISADKGEGPHVLALLFVLLAAFVLFASLSNRRFAALLLVPMLLPVLVFLDSFGTNPSSEPGLFSSFELGDSDKNKAEVLVISLPGTAQESLRAPRTGTQVVPTELYRDWQGEKEQTTPPLELVPLMEWFQGFEAITVNKLGSYGDLEASGLNASEHFASQGIRVLGYDSKTLSGTERKLTWRLVNADNQAFTFGLTWRDGCIAFRSLEIDSGPLWVAHTRLYPFTSVTATRMVQERSGYGQDVAPLLRESRRME